MPSYSDNYAHRVRLLEQRKLRLRRLGIIEGSNKWYKLLYK